jgi:hypothetical protein
MVGVTDLVVPLDVGCIVRNGIRNTEIYEFELTAYEDKISRLQVGVYDFFFMNDVYRVKHLSYRE